MRMVAEQTVKSWSRPPEPTGLELRPIPWQVWTGTRRPCPSLEVSGGLGERIATQYLRDVGIADAQRTLGALPVDVISREFAVESKIGLVSNVRQSQHWRLTFSLESPKERARLATMTASARRKNNQAKTARIELRKHELLGTLRDTLGWPVQPLTITMILNTHRFEIDLFVFQGFAARIGWNAPGTAAAYVGSFYVRRLGGDPQTGLAEPNEVPRI